MLVVAKILATSGSVASGDYFIVLPLILATVVATATSKALGAESVYETELRKRGLGWEMTLEGRQMKSPPIE